MLKFPLFAVISPSAPLPLSQAVIMVLESKGEMAIQMMVKLLKAFWEMGLITLDQMNRVSGAAAMETELCAPHC